MDKEEVLKSITKEDIEKQADRLGIVVSVKPPEKTLEEVKAEAKAEIEGEMGDSHVGLQARLMSQAMRKLTGIISKSRTTAIFINQIREKVGVMFGSPETTTGGRALKFYSSVRLDVRKIDTIKQGNDIVGNRTRIKVVKNKIAPPFRIAEFDIMYGKGVSREGCLLDIGAEMDIAELMYIQTRDN